MNRALIIVGFGIIVIVAAYVVLSQKESKPSSQTPDSPYSPSDTVVRIVDEAGKYSIEIPKDWTISQEGEKGVRFSSLIAQSPTFEVGSEDAGPSSAVRYKNGAMLYSMVTSEDKSEPYHSGSEVITEKRITIDGVPAIFYSFREPSLAEGALLDAHVQRDGKYYLFRFGYDPKTYPEGEKQFTNILNSIEFTD